MADKFDKMSIYDVEWKNIDNEGVEQSFTFKPLPFKYYPKTYDLLNKLQALEIKDESLSEEDKMRLFLEKVSKGSLIEELMELEKVMVSRSYPDLTEEKVEKFVVSNVFNLMEPLLQLINRQDTVSPRHAQAAMK